MSMWTKEQKDAIHFDHSNIIVSAGAGSGKTAVLSERVIRKLKDGVNINELLILTFTKAAAEEMKIRIRNKISKDDSLKSQLALLDASYITTFDAYALAIVKKYNYLLNVSKNISIIESSIISIKKEELLDSVFDEYYVSRDEKFLKFIDDFCVKDDGVVKVCILEMNNKLDMRYDKAEYLKNYIVNYYNDNFINKLIQEYENLILKKVSLLHEQVLKLEEFVSTEYAEKLNESLGELLIADSYQKVVSNINTIPRLPKNAEEEAKVVKEKISDCLKEIDTLCSYRDLEEIKDSLYKTKNYVEVIIEIILRLDAKVNDYKFQNDLFEFCDIAKMAIRVLEENEEICMQLRASLNEIMIDEYQDTNDLQEKFISFLAKDNVYMVGDIKQSIYRFRNANPNLFKEKYDQYSLHEGGIKIDLNKNFRSRKEVLQNINLIFNLVMSDFVGGASYSASHQMCYGNTSYDEIGSTAHSNDLEILNYVYDKTAGYSKEEIEIFTIATDIKKKMEEQYEIFDKDAQIKRPIRYEDIVILMDRSTHFYLYKKVFEYLNIPMAIYKDESITDSVTIAIVKNILYLLLNRYPNQEFKYAFISVLRSFLFREEDNVIFSYFVNQNYEDSFLLKIIESIDYFMLNPKEVMEEIIEKFAFYEKIVTVGDVDKHIAILDYLLTIADSLGKMGYTLEDFYHYLCVLQEKNYDITIHSLKQENGVKIMTIHKSKGLEFHLCYFSGLSSKFNLSDVNARFLYDKKYGIVTPFLDRGIRGTICKDLIKISQLKEEISERIRLFYVALTRAKEKMIFVASLKEESPFVLDRVIDYQKLEYRSLLDILNSIKGNLSSFIRRVDLDNIGLTHDYNYIKEYNFRELIEYKKCNLDVDMLVKEENVVEKERFSKVSTKLMSREEMENMRSGVYFHEIMENFDFTNPNYSGLDDFDVRKIQAFIGTGILDRALHLYKEYEFKYIVKDTVLHGVIDLLIEEESEFKIVDYKLVNTKDEVYIKQLKGYKEYIEKRFQKSVRVFLYSIVKESLEEIKLQDLDVLMEV